MIRFAVLLTLFFSVLGAPGVESAPRRPIPPAVAGSLTLVLVADQASVLKYPNRLAPALDAAALLGPDVWISCGDRDHRNKKTPSAWTLMWDQVFGTMSPVGLQWVTATSGASNDLNCSDDHEPGCNDADATCSSWPTYLPAFKARFPDTYPGAGLWRSRLFVKDDLRVLVILLDTRSQRVKYSTVLGSAQTTWFYAEVANAVAADVDAILIMTSVPFHDGKALDSWQRFADRDIVGATLASLCQGRCILAGADVHNRGALDDGSWHAGTTGCDDLGFGIPELSIPHLNMPTGNGNLPRLGPCWSHGSDSGEDGGGFAVVSVAKTFVDLETRRANGLILRTLRIVR